MVKNIVLIFGEFLIVFEILDQELNDPLFDRIQLHFHFLHHIYNIYLSNILCKVFQFVDLELLQILDSSK